MKSKKINLTPHVVRLNDGTEIPPSGTVARVATEYGPFDEEGVAEVRFGEITGLPAPEAGVRFVVSGVVAGAAKRPDVVSPATNHPACVRWAGQVYSVPGFLRG